MYSGCQLKHMNTNMVHTAITTAQGLVNDGLLLNNETCGHLDLTAIKLDQLFVTLEFLKNMSKMGKAQSLLCEKYETWQWANQVKLVQPHQPQTWSHHNYAYLSFDNWKQCWKSLLIKKQ